MTPYVLPLADPRVTLADAGGKALNLGILLRAGQPVPEGRVLTTAAYRAHVEAAGLGPVLADGWAEAAGADAATVERVSARLREAVVAAPVPPALAAAVHEAVAALGDGPLAVRSSATAEDLPDASFAGQQDTYLHVRGAEAVLDAVRRCWASLWTARAVAYRARQGIGPEQVALAVVLQRMVPAEAAGVLFTVHPLTGRADRMVVNATWGLGEALVSGRVNPDTYVVEKATGRVVRVDLGDKAVKTAPTATGTAEVEVPAEARGRRALTDAALAGLARHAVAIEALFGGPQDVEWAVVDGTPILLQARPVTTLAPTPPGDDAWPPTTRAETWPFDVWTQQDMGERWPEPPTPLTWSVSEPMNQEILDGMVRRLKAPYAGRIRWSLRAHGRVYMNEGALLHAFCAGMGMPLAMMKSGLTHPAAAPPDSAGWKLGPALRHAAFFWDAAVGWERNVDRFEQAFPGIDAQVDTFMEASRDGLDDAALLREVAETWYPRLLTWVACHSNATSLAMSGYEQLVDFVVARGGDEALAQDLVGGIQGVIAAEMVPSLAELAAELRALGLADALRADPAAALAALRAHPEGAPARAKLRAFLQRHGHRGAVEAELRLPRWAEAPELVLAQLPAYLEPGSAPPSGAAAARREEATTRFRASISAWLRPSFDRLLTRAHRFTRMRDNGQGFVVKLLMPIRVLLAELGARLAARGALRSPDDVWFLVLEELRAVAAGGPTDALQARADARREAHVFWLAHPAPEVLDAELEPVPPAPLAASDDPDVLVGLPASRGRVTGVARVVASPQDAARLRPGDILVTRATDPGWTPVFTTISGAVLEIGGLLSHGAIVAREYGLPAVVGVPGCTRRIRDGQRITVDGTTGRVTLEAEEAAA